MIKITLANLFIMFNFLYYSQCDSNIINGDYNITTNTTLSGSYYVTGNFYLAPNVTITVTPFSSNSCGELKIYADKITIEGIINADGAGQEGGSGGYAGNSIMSSTNDTLALTKCSDEDNPGQIELLSGYAGNDGYGSGGADGGKDGLAGSGPKQECASTNDYAGVIGGSAGASAGGGGSYGGAGETGGFGGDGTDNYSVTNVPVSSAYAVNAGYGKTGGPSGNTYGTNTQMEIAIGSGGGGAGGGGRSYSNGGIGGVGGTGGGLIMLVAYTDSLTVKGLLSVNGTNGGIGGVGGSGGIGEDGNDGCCWDPCDDCGEKTYSCGSGGGGGAGGGSGGGILLKGHGVNYIIGDLNSKGGSGGAGGAGGTGASCTYAGGWGCGSSQSISTNSGNSGDYGGGGGGGRIKIFASDCNGNIVLPNTDLFGGNGLSFGAAGYLHADNNLPCNGVTPPPVGNNSLFTNNFNLDFTAFPNPASNNINIKFNVSYVNLENVELYIYDIFGKQILTKQLSQESWASLQLNVSDLSNGIYLIKIISDSYFGESRFTIAH